MPESYTFHPLAAQKQIEIWEYTFHEWGIEQADKYIDGLHQQLANICSNLSLLRHLPSEVAPPDVKFFHYARHYVFVRETPNHPGVKIQVLSILHDSMDIPARLQEELEQL